MKPLVIPRATYKRKVQENGLECLVVAMEEMKNNMGKRTGWFEIVTRRYDHIDKLGISRNESIPFPPTVREVVEENSRAHDAATDKHGIVDLYDKYKDQVCVIAGSGRSILKDLDALRSRDRGRVKVIAINGALQALKGDADFFFVLDWSSKKEWYDGIDTSNIKCILGAACPAHMIQGFKDRYYFSGTLASSGPEWEEKWKKYGQLEQGFIAAYSAMQLAYKMGFKRIVFTGNDFAYTDLWYHWDEKITFDRSKYLESAVHEDMHGRVTVTDHRMYQGMHMLNAASMLLEECGVEVVNASEDGIWAAERRGALKDCLGDTCPAPLVEQTPFDVSYVLGNYVIQSEVAA